jgi:hypothetical protein
MCAGLIEFRVRMSISIVGHEKCGVAAAFQSSHQVHVPRALGRERTAQSLQGTQSRSCWRDLLGQSDQHNGRERGVKGVMRQCQGHMRKCERGGEANLRVRQVRGLQQCILVSSQVLTQMGGRGHTRGRCTECADRGLPGNAILREEVRLVKSSACCGVINGSKVAGRQHVQQAPEDSPRLRDVTQVHQQPRVQAYSASVRQPGHDTCTLSQGARDNTATQYLAWVAFQQRQPSKIMGIARTVLKLPEPSCNHRNACLQ